MRGQRFKQIKHEYFDLIDTSIKAYLLGFFLADGCMEINHTGRYCMSFTQKSSDIDILRLYQSEISPESLIKDLKKGDYVYSRLRITSTPIAEAFQKMGIPRKKTAIGFKFPFVDKLFQKDIIRGFFDGDGTAGVYSIPRYTGLNHTVKQVRIVSNTSQILEDIQEILFGENIVSSLKKHGKYFYLSIRSYKEWYSYLYPGVTAFPRKQIECELCTLTSSEIRSLKALNPCNA